MGSKGLRFLAVASMAVAGFVVAPLTATDARQPAEFEVFRDAFAFQTSVRVRQHFSFDEMATGTLFPNPATFGRVKLFHSTAVTSRTAGGLAYTAQSAPNVLAPFAADALAFGDTTLTFAKGTRAAGLFLILPSGSNSSAFWSTVVTAIDAKGHRIQETVTLQGTIGEQQFIGFTSRWSLASISFSPARSAAGSSTVVAVDDVMTD